MILAKDRLETKICKDCGEELPIADFYITNNGYKNYPRPECKKCTKKRYPVVNRYISLPTNHPDSIKRREKAREYTRNYRKNNPDYKDKVIRPSKRKQRCHLLITCMVALDLIQKEPCKICGCVERVRAHHIDYRFPLLIHWLCESHHKKLHIRKKKLDKLCQQQ